MSNTAERSGAAAWAVIGLVALLLLGSDPAAAERWYRVELLAFGQRGGEQLETWPPLPTLAYPDEGRFLVTDGAVPIGAEPEETAGLVLNEGEELRGELPAFHTLPESRRDLQSVADTMRRSGRYRVLFHETWAQPVASKRRAVPLILDRSGDTGQWPELQGSVKIYLSRYLHLETNLWLNTQGTYLSGDWTMPAPPLGPPSDPDAAEPEEQEAAAPPQFGGDDYYWNDDQPTDAGPTYPYRHAVALQQKRRMRSKEIHYIDHPMLGLLIKFTPLVSPEPSAVSAR